MNLSAEENNILEKIKNGFRVYHGENVLEGPARYFHDQALIAGQNDFLGERHLEMVYATLASWGMNNRRANMPEYIDFKDSILKNETILEQWHTKRVEQIDDESFKNLTLDLKSLCFGKNGIKGTTTKSKVVSASKILAHLMPDLVPPIDWKHTHRLFINTIHNPICWGEELLCSVMNVMYCLYKDKEIHDSAKDHIRHYNSTILNLPKLFDNVIITEVRKTNNGK